MRRGDVVIVRMLEGTVVAGSEAAFAEVARASVPRFRDVPGVRTIHLARRLTPAGVMEFAWLSVWDDPAQLAAFDAGSGDPPAFVREHAALIASWSLRHLETFDDPAA
jgi:heme-degrading monooxygenase HmoA